jgi:hypothetical protein
MNIITRYQANEIAKKSRAEINEISFNFLKEDCEAEGYIKKIVDSIFDKIKEDSADGLFESSIDISFNEPTFDASFYKDYGVLLESAFGHLGYIVDSISLNNGLRLFVNWE